MLEIQALSLAFVVVLFGFFLATLYMQSKLRRLRKLSAKIQGPAPLPLVGNALEFLGSPPEIFEKIYQIMDAYPDLTKLWLGPKLVYCIQKPEYSEIVLNKPGAVEKSTLYRFFRNLVGNGLISAPAHMWKKNRKALMPSLNQKVLDSFMDSINENSEVMVEILKETSHAKGDVDILHYVLNCAIDIICQTMMGSKTNVQRQKMQFHHLFDRLIKETCNSILHTEAENRSLLLRAKLGCSSPKQEGPVYRRDSLNVIFERITKLWYQLDWTYRWTSHYNTEQKINKELRTFVKEIIDKKRLDIKMNQGCEMSFEKGNEKKPLLEYLFELSSKQIAYTKPDEVLDEGVTFFMAGSDTNATSACFTLILLGMHKDMQQSLYDEIMDVVGPDRRLDVDDLPNLKFTERVIKESLRLFPGAAWMGRSVTEDISLNEDILIPEGVELLISILQMQRNAKYWPDPLKFDPDRFLPENMAGRNPYTWLPFSGGVRNCIGFKFAMIAMKSMIVNIVKNFEISTEYKKVEDVILSSNVVIRPKNGFKIQLKSR